MTKLAETTYRNVNIGLANEYARFAEANGINVYDVIAAANSQVFSHIHQPGASVGGHCIPVYPHLYMLNDTEAIVPVSSVRANEAMPKHMVDLLEAELETLDGKTVVVLGLAYRGAAKEDAFSGTFAVVQELEARGAQVSVDDPMYTDDGDLCPRFEPYNKSKTDGAILHTDHVEYNELNPQSLPGVTAIIDGRNQLSPAEWPGVTVAYPWDRRPNSLARVDRMSITPERKSGPARIFHLTHTDIRSDSRILKEMGSIASQIDCTVKGVGIERISDAPVGRRVRRCRA